MKKILNFSVCGIIVALSLSSITSCEDDISNVGSGLLNDGTTSNVLYVDALSYNTNPDSVRADDNVLQSAILGVYEESVFGRTKARFITQARLSSLNPTFGENTTVDSVILNIPVYYDSSEDDVEIDTVVVYSDPDGEESKDTVKLVRTYKLDSIYGQTDLSMTLQVKEVNEYLQTIDTMYFSNKNLRARDNISVNPAVIGTKTISNKIITTQTKLRSNTSENAPPVTYKVYLDKDFFKEKIVDNEGSSNIADQASFIRNVLNGLELSVVEDQGFLFNFNPNLLSLAVYTSYDNEGDDDEESEEDDERTTKVVSLSFTSTWASIPGFNVQINQFDHVNRSSDFVNAYTNPNTTTGDSRIYLDGLDGTRAVIELDENQLNNIRQNVVDNNWAIVGAELNLYVDDSYGFKKPPFLMAWHQYKNEEDELINENFSDLVEFYNSYPSVVQFNPMYDYEKDPNMYTIRVTDYIKKIVEQDEEYTNSRIILSMGNFLLGEENTSILNFKNPFYNNRVFNPYRLVLHGSTSEVTDKKLQLKVYYTKK